MEVERVIAHSPGHGAFLAGGRGLVGLTLDAQVHDVIPADGAVIHHDVPGPQRHGVPFLHLKSGETKENILLYNDNLVKNGPIF